MAVQTSGDFFLLLSLSLSLLRYALHWIKGWQALSLGLTEFRSPNEYLKRKIYIEEKRNYIFTFYFFQNQAQNQAQL